MTYDWHDKPWLRRTLFLGSNLLVAAIVVFGIILPLREYFADRDSEIIQNQEAIARWRAIAAEETAVQTLVREIGADRGEFLSGKNEGVIQAELQTRLKGMIEQAGARLRSVRGLQSHADGSARYVGARLEVFGTIPALHRALSAIESAKPYLFVRAAVMRPTAVMGQLGASQEPTLDAQLEIFGVMRAEAANP